MNRAIYSQVKRIGGISQIPIKSGSLESDSPIDNSRCPGRNSHQTYQTLNGRNTIMKRIIFTTGQLVTISGLVVSLLGCQTHTKEVTIIESIEKPEILDAPTHTASVVDVVSTETTPPIPIPEVVPFTPLPMSPGVSNAFDMARTQAEEDEIIGFIQASNLDFSLTAENLVYLQDNGIPISIIEQLIRKDEAIKQQALIDLTTSASPLPIENQPPPPHGVETEANPAEGPYVQAPEEAVNAEGVYAGSERHAGTASPTIETVSSSPSTQVINNNYFYNQLEPYGQWIQVGTYGSVWRPTAAVVDVGWKPYHTNGSWIYSDHGWYWKSTYSWGWAPFHYGRWHHHNNHGWVWVPGYDWGPSWVSWRYTQGYYGWAPLPPRARYSVGVGFMVGSVHVGVGYDFGLDYHHYTFSPIHHFHSHHAHHHYVYHHKDYEGHHYNNRSGHHEKHETLYKNSVVVNNYITGDNNTIINEGIGKEKIEQATRKELRKVNIQGRNQKTGRTAKADFLADKGSTLVTHRPSFRKQIPIGGSSSGSASTGNRAELRKPSTMASTGKGNSLNGRRAQSTGKRTGSASKSPSTGRSLTSNSKSAKSVNTSPGRGQAEASNRNASIRGAGKNTQIASPSRSQNTGKALDSKTPRRKITIRRNASTQLKTNRNRPSAAGNRSLTTRSSPSSRSTSSASRSTNRSASSSKTINSKSIATTSSTHRKSVVQPKSPSRRINTTSQSASTANRSRTITLPSKRNQSRSTSIALNVPGNNRNSRSGVVKIPQTKPRINNRSVYSNSRSSSSANNRQPSSIAGTRNTANYRSTTPSRSAASRYATPPQKSTIPSYQSARRSQSYSSSSTIPKSPSFRQIPSRSPSKPPSYTRPSSSASTPSRSYSRPSTSSSKSFSARSSSSSSIVRSSSARPSSSSIGRSSSSRSSSSYSRPSSSGSRPSGRR